MRILPAAAWRAAAILLLSAATLAAFSEPVRFRAVGATKLPLSDSRVWVRSSAGVVKIAGPPDTIALSPAPNLPFTYALARFRAVDGASHIRISAEFRTVGVVGGRENWRRARILLWSYDDRGRRMDYLPHDVATKDGTGDWRRYALVVPVLAKTKSFGLIVAQAGVAGTVLLRDPRLEIVAQTAIFKAMRVALLALWIGVGAWAVFPLVRRAGHPMRALVLLCGAAILAAALTPQPGFSNFTTLVASTALDGARTAGHALVSVFRAEAPKRGPRDAPAPGTEAAAPHSPEAGQPKAEAAPRGAARPARSTGMVAWPPEITLPALSHFAGFLTLGLLVALGYAGAPPALLLAGGLVFAAASETLQSFEVTRTTELGDLAVNIGGLASGLAAVAAARAARRLWRRRFPAPL